MAVFAPTARLIDDGPDEGHYRDGPRINIDHIDYVFDVEGEDGKWFIDVRLAGDNTLHSVGPFTAYGEACRFRETVLGLAAGFERDAPTGEIGWRYDRKQRLIQPPENQ